MKWYRIFFFLLALLIFPLAESTSPSCWQILVSIPQLDRTALERNQLVRIQVNGEIHDAVFIGRVSEKAGGEILAEAEQPTEAPDSLVFVAIEAPYNLYSVPIDQVSIQGSGGKAISPADTVPIVSFTKQKKGNCLAHGTFNCLRQLFALGSQNESLKSLKDAESAYGLWRHVQARLHEVPGTRADFQMSNVENILGNRQINYEKTSSNEKLIAHLDAGEPAIIVYASFVDKRTQITTNLSTGKQTIQTGITRPFQYPPWYKIHQRYNQRWANKQNLGGHAVLSVGIVNIPGRGNMAIILDSNREEIYLWDVEKDLNQPQVPLTSFLLKP